MLDQLSLPTDLHEPIDRIILSVNNDVKMIDVILVFKYVFFDLIQYRCEWITFVQNNIFDSRRDDDLFDSNASRIIQNDSNPVLELFQQRTKTFILDCTEPDSSPDRKLFVPRPWTMVHSFYCRNHQGAKVTSVAYDRWMALECRFFHLSIFYFVLRFISLIMPSYSRNSAKSGSDIYLFQLKKPLGHTII